MPSLRTPMIAMLLAALGPFTSLGAFELDGVTLTTGEAIEPVIERLGEPTSYFREDGCDCAGCRREETYFYQGEGGSLTLIAHDGILFAIRGGAQDTR